MAKRPALLNEKVRVSASRLGATEFLVLFSGSARAIDVIAGQHRKLGIKVTKRKVGG